MEAPKLYHAKYDLDDLATAVSAGEDATKIAKESYGGKLHILVNNAGAGVMTYALTKQNIEANVGRNFLAPHLLTEKVLPVLKAAATPAYKPRCVFVASVVYALSTDYDPKLCLDNPKEGGAPAGSLKLDEKGNSKASLTDYMLMYGRAKMGDVASAHYMAKKEPSISFTSLHPGSIMSNSLGFLGQVSYFLTSPFQYSASQGAVAALRAALDPAFNTVDALQGAYLHCDGNPWAKEKLILEDPETQKPYEWDKNSEKVVTLANELIAKVM